MYVIRDSNKILILLLYVDDLLFTGSCFARISWFRNQLKTRFDISPLGEGTRVNDGIFMSQNRYIEQCLQFFGISNSQSVTTPMVQRPQLLLEDDEEVDPTVYRRHIGELIQLTHTLYNINLEVGICSRYMQRPLTSLLKAIKRIWRHLSRTRDYGILFVRGEKLTLTRHVDFHYVADIENGQSTTGFVFQLGSSPVQWHSKRQSIVALSSTKLNIDCCQMQHKNLFKSMW